MRMMPVSGERVPAPRRRRFRVRWMVVFHYAIAIVSLVYFAVGWYCADLSFVAEILFGTNRFVVNDSRGIDRSVENPVLLTYLFAVVFVFAVVVGTGLLRRKLWARKWSLYTPVVTLPLWVPLMWMIARWTALSRFDGLSTDPAFKGNVTPVADVRHGMVIALLIWAVASLGYWFVLRKITRNETAEREERRTGHRYAYLGVIGMVLALFLPLIVFRVCDGRMLIHDAADYGWTRTVAVLAHVGQSLNIRTRDGRTPLHFAASAGQLDNVNYLLDHGADINALDRQKISPAASAATGRNSFWGGHNDDCQTVLLCLLKRGARVSEADEGMLTGLLGFPPSTPAALPGPKADYRGDYVRLLLKCGFPVDARDSLGYTLMDYAVECGTPSDIDYLLDHGARMYPGLAAYATEKTMAHLLKRGFDVNERDEDGRTALDWARDNHNCSSSGDGEKVVRLLVKHGAH